MAEKAVDLIRADRLAPAARIFSDNIEGATT
jgi:hypothetical protein